ncbi:putative clathrin assembly protein [Acorus calamus]|uniref:Clathrin assembly protein n=1 Tax=Acorus calamus TaxID=4465 RepID=A0AAV9DDB7_ACOCL|nr:putative clathrin assembly protein [Acorus calamus]
MRKALGAVKDQTSIGLAKVSSSTSSPELEVAIVKAMSHDNDPAEERHVREILTHTSYSRAHVSDCVAVISRRLGKTRDWIVALKALMLVHRLLADGDPSFHQEILYATRRGTRLLNLSDFRDEAHSNSWDHSAFVRTYALYLDQRLECVLYERKQSSSSSSSDAPPRDQPRRYHDDFDVPYGGGVNGGRGGDSYGRYSPGRGNSGHYGSGRDDRNERKPPPMTPVREMKAERLLGRMQHLQQLLDRFLACRPTGLAKHARMVLVALYPVVRESFQLYADICEVLAVLLDRFFDMEYSESAKAFDAYTRAAKQIDELSAFYAWCKDTGVARSSEYPEVQKITDTLLETLDEFMRDRSKRPPEKSPVSEAAPANPPPVEEEEEEPVQDINGIKALPAPEVFEERKPASPPRPPPQQEDLVNLRDDAVSVDDQSNRLALALFSAGGATTNSNGSWEAFPSSSSAAGPEVTSAWQTPAAEPGKADWELALVETVSNLSKQKATLAGGFDPLLLNGMYDQGVVKQHMSSTQTGGSASSVALPVAGKTPVLALPAPDGSVQSVGGDPFAASLSIAPPSYVQMSDMEKKQQLLVQEQQVWQQYAQNGMQGQAALARLNGAGGYYGGVPQVPMPYGMPQPYNGVGGYYYTHH